jgi:glycosyltransferase involved in cell wall biosynthesis
MRVLLLSYRGNPFCGGQGIYLYHLSRELSELGVDVECMVGPPYPDPEMESWSRVHHLPCHHMWAVKTRDIQPLGIRSILGGWNFADYLLTRFHFLGEMETFSMRAFSALSRLLKERTFDLIHDVNTLGWGTALMKLHGIPVISTIHHPLTRDRAADLADNRGLWEMATTLLFYPILMQRFVINRLDRVITSFRGGIEELNQAFGIPREKVSSIYNGMDIRIFQPGNEKRDEKKLLFVGNTEDRKKGIEYLLEAMTILPEDIHLTIVDEGPPAKEHATSIIKRHNLENRVTLTGRLSQEEIVAYYQRATLLVIPSLYEGFGLPAAEAMACELPVVATAAGALQEVVTPETGILVQPRDSEQLAGAVNKLLKDENLRKKMGRQGRKRAEDLFSWPSAARLTLDLYREVIEESKLRP